MDIQAGQERERAIQLSDEERGRRLAAARALARAQTRQKTGRRPTAQPTDNFVSGLSQQPTEDKPQEQYQALGKGEIGEEAPPPGPSAEQPTPKEEGGLSPEEAAAKQEQEEAAGAATLPPPPQPSISPQERQEETNRLQADIKEQKKHIAPVQKEMKELAPLLWKKRMEAAAARAKDAARLTRVVWAAIVATWWTILIPLFLLIIILGIWIAALIGISLGPNSKKANTELGQLEKKNEELKKQKKQIERTIQFDNRQLQNLQRQ